MKHKYVIILVFSLFLFGCDLETNEKSIYTGTIEANDVSIGTELGGRILNILVADGEKIAQGTEIAEIDTTDFKIKLKKAKAGLKASEAKLDEIIEGAREQELENATANIKNIEMQLVGAKKNYDYRLENYNNLKELFENSVVAQQKIEDAKALVDSEETKVRSLEKHLEAVNSQLDLLLSGARKQKIEMVKAEVDIAKAEIELLENQISKGYVKAPIDGTIESIYYNIGESVALGGNIGKIIDLEDLWVKIYVPEKELYKVSLNQEKNLLLDSTDGVVKGKVIYISSEAEFTPKNVESKENKEETVFEVKIKILDKNSLLKPGMFIDVDLEADS